MKPNIIHRNTNYMLFVSGLDTNATNNGEKCEAFKDDYNRWTMIDGAGKRWSASILTLRTLIDTGELLKQAHIEYTAEQKLAIGL